MNTRSVLILKIDLRGVIIRVTPFQLEQPLCLLVALEDREFLVVENFITIGGMVGAGLLHLGCGGVSSENLIPDSRKGKLDAGLLATMGLTHSRIIDIDALFFYQLLLPLCNPARSGILHDLRL